MSPAIRCLLSLLQFRIHCPVLSAPPVTKQKQGSAAQLIKPMKLIFTVSKNIPMYNLRINIFLFPICSVITLIISFIHPNLKYCLSDRP